MACSVLSAQNCCRSSQCAGSSFVVICIIEYVVCMCQCMRLIINTSVLVRECNVHDCNLTPKVFAGIVSKVLLQRSMLQLTLS